MDILSAHIIYALAWVSFGLGHTVLSGDRLKPLFGRTYRLAYNVIAVVHIGVVIAVGGWAFAVLEPTFVLPGWAITALFAVAVVGALILLMALKTYDLGLFAGTRQMREGLSGETPDPLVTTGWHAYVRHPLYLGAYLLLWGLVRNDLSLATAIWGSLYLLIGTHFEERKLLALYGDAYADYKARVPAVIPWKGKTSAWRRAQI